MTSLLLSQLADGLKRKLVTSPAVKRSPKIKTTSLSLQRELKGDQRDVAGVVGALMRAHSRLYNYSTRHRMFKLKSKPLIIERPLDLLEPLAPDQKQRSITS